MELVGMQKCLDIPYTGSISRGMKNNCNQIGGNGGGRKYKKLLQM